jgi:hypothetical protein
MMRSLQDDLGPKTNLLPHIVLNACIIFDVNTEETIMISIYFLIELT